MRRFSLKTKLGVVKTEAVPCFRFTLKNGAHHRIDFTPVDNCPGFTHRVAWNGVLTRKHLGEGFPPTQTSALDMLDMLVSERLGGGDEDCSDCPKGQPGFRCLACPYSVGGKDGTV